MTRRRITRYSELTSLLDVLFILVFAALVRNAALSEQAEAPDTRPEPVDAGVDAGTDAAPPDAAPPDARADAGATLAAQHASLRERALTELSRSMRERTIVYARIGRGGELRAVEQDGTVTVPGVNTALVERSPDPYIGLAYTGEREPDRRVCGAVRHALGKGDLDGHLVIFVPDAPLAELPFALVEGLRRDQERCFLDERGVGILLEPEAVDP